MFRIDNVDNPFFEFVTLKDPHMNFGFANRIRYTHNEDMNAKLDFLKEYMLKNNLTKLFVTGDLTDSNDEKKWSFKQYLANKMKLNEFTDKGIEIYSNAGNHDMFNGYESTDETVFGEFVEEKVIRYITKSPIAVSNEVDSNGAFVTFYGVDYSKHKEIVESNILAINNVEKKENEGRIIMLHSHVTPAEIAVTDFTYEELVRKYPNIDLFICGHYHGGFPTQSFNKVDLNGKQINGHTTIINNWSFQRVVRDYYNEMDIHTPEFEHVKIGWSFAYNALIISSSKIEVPHKTYAEAFRPKVVDLLKMTKKEHFEFFEKINFEELEIGGNDLETLANIGSNDKIDKKIVNLAIKYLNEVENYGDDDE